MTIPTYKHSKPTRILYAHPRLFGGVALGGATALLIPSSLVAHQVTRGIIGWNVGALLYLVLTLHMMFWSTHERMRERAVVQDDGRFMMLIMVVTAAVSSLAAIVGELALAKALPVGERSLHIVLAVVTLLSSWAFTQATFATHYAHDYYAAVGRGEAGGLKFPDEPAPDYADFLYFSCVIGTSGQTADVCFTSRALRRTGLLHCVLAFFFNATLLALSINIASGLV